MYSAARSNEVRHIARLWLVGALAARIWCRTAPTHPASDWSLELSCAAENEAARLQEELRELTA